VCRCLPEDIGNIDAPVAQAAALGIGGIVHVGHDVHQAALTPVLDGRGVGALVVMLPRGKSA